VKDFNDFRERLKANMAEIVKSSDVNRDKASLSDPFMLLYRVNVEILKEYHQWLHDTPEEAAP